MALVAALEEDVQRAETCSLHGHKSRPVQCMLPSLTDRINSPSLPLHHSALCPAHARCVLLMRPRNTLSVVVAAASRLMVRATLEVTSNQVPAWYP